MILADEAATLALGAELAGHLTVGDVVTLSGPLGSGKTTLARGCIAALGYAGEVASPTFTVVQSYGPAETRLPLLHVDLYRLDHADEAEELGLDDARADHALLIEWPERLGARLWPDALRLAFEPCGPDARRLTAHVPAAWEGRWPPLPRCSHPRTRPTSLRAAAGAARRSGRWPAMPRSAATSACIAATRLRF